MVSSLIFQRFSREGLTEPPPQTPPPAFTWASPSVRASPSIVGRFAPSTRASPSILGRFAPSIRASPLTFDWGPWFGPQNKFLDPPLLLRCIDTHHFPSLRWSAHSLGSVHRQGEVFENHYARSKSCNILPIDVFRVY